MFVNDSQKFYAHENFSLYDLPGLHVHSRKKLKKILSQYLYS